MKVVVVDCDENGNVDVADLKAKAEAAQGRPRLPDDHLPSTHGVFEEAVKDICAIVHANGGQVYMDGANLNAQVGLTSPGHRRRRQPHEPAQDLRHPARRRRTGHGPDRPQGPSGAVHGQPRRRHRRRPARRPGAVSAAPFGSASILPISWMYLAMLGGEGRQEGHQVAILNANYVASPAQGPHYPVLYVGKNGRVAHECILDIRPIKAATGIAEIDIAKRLMDYGFHAPTVSFPVAGTIMVEPTESGIEGRTGPLHRRDDRIRKRNPPIERRTAGRQQPAEACPAFPGGCHRRRVEPAVQPPGSRLPLPWVAANKFWPSVNRIDDVYGDRNLNCACPPMEVYAD